VNKLRLFTRPPADGAKVSDIFYSQRGSGPIYCWYKKDLGQWRVVRMSSDVVHTRELCATTWKSVPQKLQAQLSDHYLE
jgi:hypothetical protein